MVSGRFCRTGPLNFVCILGNPPKWHRDMTDIKLNSRIGSISRRILISGTILSRGWPSRGYKLVYYWKSKSKFSGFNLRLRGPGFNRSLYRREKSPFSNKRLGFNWDAMVRYRRSRMRSSSLVAVFLGLYFFTERRYRIRAAVVRHHQAQIWQQQWRQQGRQQGRMKVSGRRYWKVQEQCRCSRRFQTDRRKTFMLYPLLLFAQS